MPALLALTHAKAQRRSQSFANYYNQYTAHFGERQENLISYNEKSADQSLSRGNGFSFV